MKKPCQTGRKLQNVTSLEVREKQGGQTTCASDLGLLVVCPSTLYSWHQSGYTVYSWTHAWCGYLATLPLRSPMPAMFFWSRL